MSTSVVYNGFGKYETGEKGEKGITLRYAGVPFWLPYKKLTYFPDFTFREVDHDKTTAQEGEEGFLTYKSFRISGERLVEELIDTQVPVSNKERGIIRVDMRKRTGKFLGIYAGIDEEGVQMRTEVPEIEVSSEDVQMAERLALKYKENIVQEYFQSKRERMAGGKGRLTAEGLTKVFMEELGVKDIDALPTQGGNSNLEQLLTQLLTGAINKPSQEPTKGPAKLKENSATGLV